MAYTYTHTPVLSKVKLGNTTYYLKDADVRAILDTFGNIVVEDKLVGNITDGATGIPNADQVYDFVIGQITEVGKALNLIAATDHDDVTEPKIGDFVVESDGSEWLYDGHEWREVGSEGAYVVKTQTIAGIDMQDNITVAELQQALGLKALAYKDSGSVSVTTVDGINSFSTGKAGTYDVSSTPVSVPATYSAMDVTPAGGVTVTAGTAAAASYDKTTGVTMSSAAAGDATPTYTPSGSVTITDITVTPATGSVATVTNAGSAYQLTAGSCSKAADTTSAFATEGIVATVGTGEEAETLIIAAAGTNNAVTASGAITYVDPSLSGSLPTFGTQSVVTGITSSSGTASFSGDGVVLSATPTYTATSATMTQPTFTAEFEGTSKSVTPTVATTVQAAGTNGSVVVDSETISNYLQFYVSHPSNHPH